MLPAWVAVSEHVPTVTIVMSNPETVQMLVFVEVTVTARLEVAVGAMENDAADHARSAGSANEIV